MTNVEKHEPGAFCWVELATTDLAGAREFYRSLFGWRESSTPVEGWPEYVTFALAAGRGAAGGYEQPEQERSMGVPPHWNLYVSTDDVDKTVAMALEAGGTAMVPGMDTPNGRMAILTDPTGAMFCLWQSDTMPGFKARDEPGSLSWVELVSNDPDAAARFYEAVFGWTTRSEPMGEDRPPYSLFRQHDRYVAGLFPPQSPEIPNSWTAYPEVADAEDAVARVKELGGEVRQEPMTVPGAGTFAVVADPVGAVFAVIKSE